MKHPCLDLVFVERNSEVFDILTVKYDGGIYHLKMWKQGTLCKFKSAEALVCFIDQFYLSDVLVNSCKAALVMNDDGLFEKRTSTPVSYTHLRAHETRHDLVCRLL